MGFHRYVSSTERVNCNAVKYGEMWLHWIWLVDVGRGGGTTPSSSREFRGELAR